jgi:hypothetical protein
VGIAASSPLTPASGWLVPASSDGTAPHWGTFGTQTITWSPDTVEYAAQLDPLSQLPSAPHEGAHATSSAYWMH